MCKVSKKLRIVKGATRLVGMTCCLALLVQLSSASEPKCPISCTCKEVNGKGTNMGKGLVRHGYYEQEAGSGIWVLSTNAIAPIMTADDGTCVLGTPTEGKTIGYLVLLDADLTCSWNDPPPPGGYYNIELIPPDSPPETPKAWTQRTCAKAN